MAANMPLLVERDWNLGFTGALVYRTHLETSADDAPPQIRLSPHPVARWPGGEQSVGALAVVSGNTILGTVDAPRAMVVVHDIAGADQAAPGPRLLGSKRCPAMLPVGDGDDTVVVMDTVGACGFEALRRLPDGTWRADPLPDPPVHDDEEEDGMDEDYYDGIESYFAIGTRVWISVSARGTFSLDVAERGAAWRTEGDWELPLRRRAFFAPELGGGSVVVGIAATGADGIDRGNPEERNCLVCALDVEARPPAVRRVWQIPAARPEDVAPGEMVSLAYLGNGRICVARSVVVELSKVTGTSFKGKGTSFTVAELTDGAAGEPLQLANNCHVWPQGHFGQASFIQPA